MTKQNEQTENFSTTKSPIDNFLENIAKAEADIDIFEEIGDEETIIVAKIIRVSKCTLKSLNNNHKYGYVIFFEGNPNPCANFLFNSMDDAKTARAELLEKIKKFYEVAYFGR